MFSADLGGYTAPLPAATDPPFQKVALLLHGDGTNGAQNNTFVDSSTNNFSITRTGNVAQGTFSPFSLAERQWSNYFDGTGDYLDNTSNYLISSTTSTFTVEAWIYMTAAPTNDAYNIPSMISVNCGGGNNSVNYMSFGPISSQKLKLRWFDGTQKGAVGSTTLSLNTWYHVACSVSSNAISIYLNGVAEALTGDTTLTNRSGDANGFALGQTYTYANYSGYISNARVVSGTALYTTNFTPSTSPLTAISGTSLLTCQSNRFKDNSSNNFTITRNGDTKVTAFSPFAPSAAYSASTNGGSAYFDGSGDWLVGNQIPSIAVGTGDFTVESWIYLTVPPSGYKYVFNSSGYSSELGLRLAGSALEYSVNQNIILTGGAVTMNSWFHVAVSRQSGTTRLFVNGVIVNSVADTQNVAATIPSVSYLARASGSYLFTGYITDVRFTTSSIYTSNFAPTTAPLTAITNTQLLLNCTNAGIIDNAGKNNIETVGNAQISTSVKKYGTGSMYFDGSGDYLLNQGNIDSFTFGTGDFTIEGWFSFSSLVSGGTFVDFRPFGGNGVYPAISYNSTYGITYFVNGSNVINSNLTPTVGTWYHIAISRSGSSTKMFINGVQYGSTWTDTTNYIVGGRGPVIGVNAFNTSLAFNGYIDDLRITKGQALYTANFTPPTQAFPNV